MNIYAKEGAKVRYLGKNGYDSDRTRIEALGIRAGDILTVHFTHVYSSSTTVYFREIDDGHNSVMFEDVE